MLCVFVWCCFSCFQRLLGRRCIGEQCTELCQLMRYTYCTIPRCSCPPAHHCVVPKPCCNQTNRPPSDQTATHQQPLSTPQVERFVVARELEAPDRFRAIQTHRATLAVLRRQLTTIDHLHEYGMIDDTEVEIMRKPVAANERRMLSKGPKAEVGGLRGSKEFVPELLHCGCCCCTHTVWGLVYVCDVDLLTLRLAVHAASSHKDGDCQSHAYIHQVHTHVNSTRLPHTGPSNQDSP